MPRPRLLLWQALLLSACGLWMQGAAQDPMGSFAECGPGRTYRVLCYVNSAGYLADVIYRNTVPPTDVTICNAPQQQLQQATRTTLQISATDSFIRMVVCEDGQGVRGVAFFTALGDRLECGTVDGKACTPYSSGGTYPLGGFTGSCEAATRGPSKQRLTVVTNLFGACWNRQPTPRTTACPPGAGSAGGGQPCLACQPGFYAAGGRSPCLPCPEGKTTIAPASSVCGCFPGYGVYGPVNQDPDVCEECPAGTYSIGGALAPCQPCSTDAFDYLTSAPGSRSIADCTCAAGFGSTDANPHTCSTCPQGTFNEGPLPRATEAARAAATGLMYRSSSSSVATRVLVSAEQPDAPWDATHQATGSQSDAGGSCAAGGCEQQSQQNSEADTEFARPAATAAAAVAAAAAASGSSVAVTAAVSPQQSTNSWGWLRNSGVNPVFYEPTYNPCTPCGPACWTDHPGATSVRQCVCAAPRSPSPSTPPPSPPPSPSPSPGVSPSPPGPTPSPSPSPPPFPPNPSPSPSPPSPPPGVLCVQCFPEEFDPILIDLCDVDDTVRMELEFCADIPSSLINRLAFTSTPINIFQPDSDIIVCDTARANPNAALTLVYGLKAGTPTPTDCSLPAPQPFTLPDFSLKRKGAGGMQGASDRGRRAAAPVPGTAPRPSQTLPWSPAHSGKDAAAPGLAGAPVPRPAWGPDAPQEPQDRPAPAQQHLRTPAGQPSPDSTSWPPLSRETVIPWDAELTPHIEDDSTGGRVSHPDFDAVPPPAPAPAPTHRQGRRAAPTGDADTGGWLMPVSSEELLHMPSNTPPTGLPGTKQGARWRPADPDTSEWLNAVSSEGLLDAPSNTPPTGFPGADPGWLNAVSSEGLLGGPRDNAAGATGGNKHVRRANPADPDTTDWLQPVSSEELLHGSFSKQPPKTAAGSKEPAPKPRTEAPQLPKGSPAVVGQRGPAPQQQQPSSTGKPSRPTVRYVGQPKHGAPWVRKAEQQQAQHVAPWERRQGRQLMRMPSNTPPTGLPGTKQGARRQLADPDTSEWLNAVSSEGLLDASSNTPPTESPGTDREWLNAVSSEGLLGAPRDNAAGATGAKKHVRRANPANRDTSDWLQPVSSEELLHGVFSKQPPKPAAGSKEPTPKPRTASPHLPKGSPAVVGQRGPAPQQQQQQPSSAGKPSRPTVRYVGQPHHGAPWVRKAEQQQAQHVAPWERKGRQNP